MTRINLATFKVCKCGRVHSEIPEGARFQESGDELAGWYFECECRSTLFIPVKEECVAC